MGQEYFEPLVDYATARWLLLGAIPAVIVGAIAADLLSDRLLAGSSGFARQHLQWLFLKNVSLSGLASHCT